MGGMNQMQRMKSMSETVIKLWGKQQMNPFQNQGNIGMMRDNGMMNNNVNDQMKQQQQQLKAQQQMMAQQMQLLQQQQMMIDQASKQQQMNNILRPSQPQVGQFIYVLFRQDHPVSYLEFTPFFVQCMPNDKVSILIDKFRNKVNFKYGNIKLSYNSKSLNPNLTVAEAGLNEISIISVCVY